MILTYHSVGPTSLAVPQNMFRQQMEWLRENAAIVDLEKLLAGTWPKSEMGVTCAVTFDDGYASVYRDAFPVLQELQLPATVYLVGDAIGETSRRQSNDFSGLYPDEEMLLWEEVREMGRHGISFGSHLLRHKDLTSLSDADKKLELEDSKRLIEDQLGFGCPSFCYPWGKHDDRSVDAVKTSGYRNAVIAIQGRWRAGDRMDMYRIPRADVRRDYSLEDFAAVVRGDWDFLGHLQKFRRMVQ
jgi:peptidoglycan/xylan/chitin deacetylase (PgdA/CDA1 family)